MKTRSIFLAVLLAAAAISVSADDCPVGASWCSGLYQYDGVGNIRAIGSDVYFYDTAGRLVSGTAEVQRGGASRQDYGYDAYGNRISASRAAGSVGCLGGCEQSPTIDGATNHINSNGADYDAAGNLIAIQNTVNNVTYSSTYVYDAVGSMVGATAGTDIRQFIYTADDERIATRNGQNWTWTVRDLDNKVLREYTSLEQNGQPGLPTQSRQWAKDYVWRDGLLLASVTPTTPGANTTVTQHFHLDHLGTPRLVSNDAGVRIGIHAYYPFGAELSLSPNEQPSELMKFTGHERDLLASNPNTLDYMHARYEIGTMGRFLSVDPVLGKSNDPQTWNRYAYVGNNPITYNDPNGKERPFNPSHFDWTAFNRDVTAALKFLSTPQGKALAVQVVLAVVTHSVSSVPTPASTPIPVAEAPLPSVLPPPEVPSNGGLPSTLRYTQPGETFIRYESGNPAFSKVSSNGSVAPGTYAAPASDGVIPISGRAGAYNLPSPEIPRSQVFQLQPAAGTPIIGPRPVVGGTGNEVLFPSGGQCTVTTLGRQ